MINKEDCDDVRSMLMSSHKKMTFDLSDRVNLVQTRGPLYPVRIPSTALRNGQTRRSPLHVYPSQGGSTQKFALGYEAELRSLIASRPQSVCRPGISESSVRNGHKGTHWNGQIRQFPPHSYSSRGSSTLTAMFSRFRVRIEGFYII